MTGARVPSNIRLRTAIYHKTVPIQFNLASTDTDILVMFLPGAAMRGGSAPNNGIFNNVVIMTGNSTSPFLLQFKSIGMPINFDMNTANYCSKFIGISSGGAISTATCGTNGNLVTSGPLSELASSGYA